MFYAFGSNGSGQLGLGHTEDVATPHMVSIEGNPAPWKVKQLAAGGNHTVILCEDGHVRVTGNNEDGRCALRHIKQVTHFTEIPLPVDEKSGEPIEVRQVAAGWATTFLLDTNGVVYVCGSGNSGELGLGTNVTQSESLQCIPAFGPLRTQVVALASGVAHAIAILSNGEVHGWGKARRGQLGVSANAIWKPQRIDGLDFKAVHAACGKDFSILAGQPGAGEIALLGAHKDDRFGIKADAPTSVVNWKSIAASWGSGYVLTTGGHLMSWGRNDHGQLPMDSHLKIASLAAGSEHCVALTEDRSVVAWGWGEHGNCGMPLDDNGDVKSTYNIIEIAGRVSKIFAGCSTSFVQTDDG